MSKKEDTPAKRAIIREWDDWAAKNPDGAKSATAGGMFFFVHLQKERGDLLTFKADGDKWQVVHGWLLREGRVKD